MRQRWRWLLSVGAVTAVGASAACSRAAGQWPGRHGSSRARRGCPGVGRQIRPARTVPAAMRPVPAPTAWRWKRRPWCRHDRCGREEVQKRLKALKYYPGNVDGEFGPSMLEAVWAFKEVQGLRTGLTPTTSAPA